MNRSYGMRQMNPAENPGTIGIMVICLAMFLWMLIDIDSTVFMMMWPDNTMPWMFVTSIFLHGGFSHIFWNMFMLYMFGMALERMIGTRWFLVLFIVSGILGNIGYVVFCNFTGSTIPAVGASGALYGMFACLAIMRPEMKVYLFFMIPMRIVHALILFAALDIIFLNADDSIAHAAHLAGLIGGLMFGMYLRRNAPRPKPTLHYSYSHDTAPYR